MAPRGCGGLLRGLAALEVTASQLVKRFQDFRRNLKARSMFHNWHRCLFPTRLSRRTVHGTAKENRRLLIPRPLGSQSDLNWELRGPHKKEDHRSPQEHRELRANSPMCTTMFIEYAYEQLGGKLSSFTCHWAMVEAKAEPLPCVSRSLT